MTSPAGFPFSRSAYTATRDACSTTVPYRRSRTGYTERPDCMEMGASLCPTSCCSGCRPLMHESRSGLFLCRLPRPYDSGSRYAATPTAVVPIPGEVGCLPPARSPAGYQPSPRCTAVLCRVGTFHPLPKCCRPSLCASFCAGLREYLLSGFVLCFHRWPLSAKAFVLADRCPHVVPSPWDRCLSWVRRAARVVCPLSAPAKSVMKPDT